MRSVWKVGAAIFALFLGSAPLLTAQVTSVAPFVGTHTETWEDFGVNNLPNGTSILGGIATISGSGDMVTAKKFQLCSVFAKPSDGSIFMDQDRPDDVVTISFSRPVSAFGAYWGSGYHCPQCCRFNDAANILTFQDVNGNVIGSDSFYYSGDGTLMWRGYTFGTPVKTITRTASDHQEGVAIDGLQATVAAAMLKITSIAKATNTIHLDCVGAPSANNRIESSGDLSPVTFTTLASVTADASGAFHYDDANAGTKKFYRIAYP